MQLEPGRNAMNRRDVLSLSATTALGLALLTSSAIGQQKSLKEQLVGSWTFVSAADTNKDGTKTNRWGPNPKGLFIFDANGRYAFMISRSDIPKFTVNNVNEGTAEENKAVVRGIIANIGTWSIDEASKSLTTNIEAGSFPNLNGNSQKRIISSLTADELKYTNPVTSTGAVTEAVWKRAK
jgi:hypothetical protein